MDVQKLVEINKKIDEAIVCIADLREENARLRSKNESLSLQATSQTDNIGELKKKIASFGTNAEEVEKVLSNSDAALKRLDKEIQRASEYFEKKSNKKDSFSEIDTTTPKSENFSSTETQSNTDSATSLSEALKVNDPEIEFQSPNDDFFDFSNKETDSSADESPKQDETLALKEETTSFIDDYVKPSGDEGDATQSSDVHESSEPDSEELETNIETVAEALEEKQLINSNASTQIDAENGSEAKKTELTVVVDAVALDFDTRSEPLAENGSDSQYSPLWSASFDNKPNVSNSENAPKKDENTQNNFSLFDFPGSSR